jgi:hypothetical protein
VQRLEKAGAWRLRICSNTRALRAGLRCRAADRQWSGLCWAAELGELVAVAQNGSGSRVMLSR